jgi:hypothetical protein
MSTTKTIWLGIAISLFINALSINAQQFYRVKARYSLKYTDSKGNQILHMGVAFYDLNTKKLVMKNGFPIRENLVQTDTTVYTVRNEVFVGTTKAYALVELSIFHMALTGELNNYGLDKAGYRLENVKSDKGLIITTWQPPEEAKESLGKILVSTREKKLYTIVFLDTNEKVIAKHFYRDYRNFNGFVFPAEVLKITYKNNEEESFKLTKYDNIKVNDNTDEEYYNYQIPEKKN